VPHVCPGQELLVGDALKAVQEGRRGAPVYGTVEPVSEFVSVRERVVYEAPRSQSAPALSNSTVEVSCVKIKLCSLII